MKCLVGVSMINRTDDQRWIATQPLTRGWKFLNPAITRKYNGTVSFAAGSCPRQMLSNAKQVPTITTSGDAVCQLHTRSTRRWHRRATSVCGTSSPTRPVLIRQPPSLPSSLHLKPEKLEDVSSITSMDFSTDREVLQATTRYTRPSDVDYDSGFHLLAEEWNSDGTSA